MFVKRVAVVGAGTMGAEIAYLAANAGIPVVLTDVDRHALERAETHIADLFTARVNRGRLTADEAEARRQNFSVATDFRALSDVSLAIEAVSEREDLKQAVFRELDDLLPPLSLIVSNTSSLSISALARATRRPDRVAGFHFFYPAHVMKLVEVVRGDDTSRDTVDTLCRVAEEWRKLPVVVQDTPGFVVNRVLMAAMAEVLRFQEDTALPYREIDEAVVRARLAPLGPFVLADALGLDVILAVADSLARHYGDRFGLASQLRELVAAGRLGLKSGGGFYSY
ncbi:MAG: 3-hydroxyacyl-CoA dehydrogenase family protein [Firmicutes bacterium]|nr:3-hydroxyacyl-CoA dehydrogenase family protein [Bacillota bacterium]